MVSDLRPPFLFAHAVLVRGDDPPEPPERPCVPHVVPADGLLPAVSPATATPRLLADGLLLAVFSPLDFPEGGVFGLVTLGLPCFWAWAVKGLAREGLAETC